MAMLLTYLVRHISLFLSQLYPSSQQGTLPSDPVSYESLDEDGLPPVGALLQEGDPLYRLVGILNHTPNCSRSYIDVASNKVIVMKYKSHEPAYVDQVRYCNNSIFMYMCVYVG